MPYNAKVREELDQYNSTLVSKAIQINKTFFIYNLLIVQKTVI